MKTVKLELKNGLKFYVSGQEITLALNGVNVAFETGEFVAITGESGSGKSTLAHVLAGVFPCQQGELFVDGESTSQYSESDWENYRREYVSFVAQNYGILPGNSVFDNIISALYLAGMPKREAKKRAAYLLKQVDLWSMRYRRAGKLSSGQKQRLSVARAIAKPAPILVADEPTGNLDWRTASKIIKLFYEVSKERAVIMITHNFEIVDEYVTRHISMHDGEITGDVLVERGENRREEAQNPSEQIPAKKTEKKKIHGGYIAKLQMKARPVWSFLMVLFFSLTAFAMFAFLGSFFAALDDTGTKYYSTEAFLNGTSTRLVVMREDEGAFEDADFEALIQLPYVARIERYGVLSDINYHYREGVDYDYEITSKQTGGFEYERIRQVVLGDSYTYLQTVPLLPEGVEFLKAGRLPKHMNEVVAVGSVKLVGTTVDVYFQDRNTWGGTVWHKEKMRIVGVTDIGEGLYFDDRIGITFSQTAKYKELMGELFKDATLYYFVEDGESVYSENYYPTSALYTYLYSRWTRNYRIPAGILNLNSFELYPLDDVASEKTTNLTGYIGVSEESFDAVSRKEYGNQISVYIEDYSYVDRVMKKIEALGYSVISPYRISATRQSDSLAKERMSTLVLCLMAVGVTLVAQVVVLSAMFHTQMENLKQMRNIGLSCRTGKKAIWIQVLVLTALGQVVGMGLIFFLQSQGIEYIRNVVKYLTSEYLAIMVLVHLTGSVLLAMVVCLMLRSKVFPFLPKSYEIDLSEIMDGEERSRA